VKRSWYLNKYKIINNIFFKTINHTYRPNIVYICTIDFIIYLLYYWINLPIVYNTYNIILFCIIRWNSIINIIFLNSNSDTWICFQICSILYFKNIFNVVFGINFLCYIIRSNTHNNPNNPTNDSMHNSSQLKYDLRIYKFTLRVR